MESSAFRVTTASTPSMSEAVYRLRYDIFFVEHGDGRYADHDHKTWSDRDDGPPSHLIVALDDSERVIGTIRLTRWRDKDLIAKEAYSIDVIARFLGMDLDSLENRACRVDRVVVAKEWRGKSVIKAMQQFSEQYSLDMGCDILLGLPGVQNPRAKQAFAKDGWGDTPIVATYGGFTAQVTYKRLQKEV